MGKRAACSLSPGCADRVCISTKYDVCAVVIDHLHQQNLDRLDYFLRGQGCFLCDFLTATCNMYFNRKVLLEG